jgi:nicotinate-nucleotide pyrophosphorylase (carboxylating)
MVKDNHLTGLSITEAVERARDLWPGRTIHVEADRREQMLEALEVGATIILLDNFSPPELTDLVAEADRWAVTTGRTRSLLEASGGITLETLDAYADTGVDLVSSGSITNSAPVLDIGLDVVPGD